MTLVEAISAHVNALPPNLQREALDYIAFLETRYGVARPAGDMPGLTTEDFIARHAGALGDDFPDDIDLGAEGDDSQRESIE